MSQKEINGIRLDKASLQIYDREQTSRTVIFLKGVGTRCIVCNKHIIKRQHNQETCSAKCRAKKHYIQKGKKVFGEGLHAYITLKKTGNHRMMRVYLNRGKTEEINITPQYKELWDLCEKISNFRDKPLEIIKC